MDGLYLPNRYMPKDFSTAPNANIRGRLINGADLAPEVWPEPNYGTVLALLIRMEGSLPY